MKESKSIAFVCFSLLSFAFASKSDAKWRGTPTTECPAYWNKPSTGLPPMQKNPASHGPIRIAASARAGAAAIAAALWLGGCVSAPRPMDPQVVRFGVVADIQYADKPARGSRYYRNSLAKLDQCVAWINERKPQFTAVLGDFVDQDAADSIEVMRRLRRLDAPARNALGNHDYQKATDPAGLYRRFDMPAPYYAFDAGHWRFVVLNTNEVSEYAGDGSAEARARLQALYQELRDAGRTNMEPYNGGIGPTQLAWMEARIVDAERQGKDVIVFSHHPLLPENGLEALDNRAILAALRRHPRVRAAISGHEHKGAFALDGKLPVVTLEGMVETADSNACGLVELRDGKISIAGFGRLTPRELAFQTAD